MRLSSRIAIGATSSLLLGSVVMPSQAHAFSFASAQGFNTVVFDTLNASGGDTEGRLLVGGDLFVKGSYSVGTCSSGIEVCGNPFNNLTQSNGTRDDLVVLGNVTGKGYWGNVAWSADYGNAVVGGSITGVDISTPFGSQNTVVENTHSSIDINTMRQSLAADSLATSKLSSNAETISVVDQWGSLVLTGTNTDRNVFNLDASQWSGNGRTVYIDTPDSSEVIINVGGKHIDISGGSINFGTTGCLPAIYGSANTCDDATERGRNLNVNYYEAETLNLSYFEHSGSVMAPLADLAANGGAITGQAIVANAETTNGFEFHYRQLRAASIGDPEPRDIPEPTSWLGMLLVGLATWRKSKGNA